MDKKRVEQGHQVGGRACQGRVVSASLVARRNVSKPVLPVSMKQKLTQCSWQRVVHQRQVLVCTLGLAGSSTGSGLWQGRRLVCGVEVVLSAASLQHHALNYRRHVDKECQTGSLLRAGQLLLQRKEEKTGPGQFSLLSKASEFDLAVGGLVRPPAARLMSYAAECAWQQRVMQS